LGDISAVRKLRESNAQLEELLDTGTHNLNDKPSPKPHYPPKYQLIKAFKIKEAS